MALGVIIFAAALAANLVALKIAADQVQAQASTSSLGKLLGLA
jgi:hypothetical protein